MDDKSDVRIVIPKFDGTDYSVWKAQVEAVLVSKDSDNVLRQNKPQRILTLGENGARPTAADQAIRDNEIASWEKKNKYVKSLLLLALDNRHAKLILGCTTARQMWERLSAIHEQKSNASKIGLQKEFFELQMNADEKVSDFIARAEYLYNQLKDVGVTAIDQTMLVSKIVSGLPRRYLNFMTTWSNLDPTQQTFVQLIARLTAEESLVNKFRKMKVENAMYSEAKSSKSAKSSDGKAKSNNKRFRKKKNSGNKCHNCQKEGHWARDCPEPKADSKRKKPGDKVRTEEAKVAEEYAIVVEEVNFCQGDRNWIVDTGATRHMSTDRSDFINYRPVNNSFVAFADHSEGKNAGVGDVKLVAFVNGTTRSVVLKDVIHVPQLRRKLISISAVTDRGCYGEISPDKIVIKNNQGLDILIAIKTNGLYEAQVKKRSIEAHAATAVDQLTLWHGRFGHINKRYIVKTSKLVDGLPEMDSALLKPSQSVGDVIDCESCKLGKQPKLKMPPRTQEKAKEVGETIHMDICQVDTPTLGGCKYFILFKDEYSSYRFIYFMKAKSEAYDCLRQLVSTIAADTGRKVRYLMSDCGSEFTSGRTQEFMIQHNIVHKTSAPFHAAQNGIIERDNRTVMEGVRSMLVHMKVQPELWGEAAKTFVQLLNSTMNVTVEKLNKTPFEIYFGKRPKVGFLRVFGCLAFYKTQTKKRSGYQAKLEMRASRGLLVGYHCDFTYRIFDPVQKKIIITHDVVFDEFKAYEEGSDHDYSAIEEVLNQLDQDDAELSLDEEDSQPIKDQSGEVFSAEAFEQCLAAEVQRNAIGDIMLSYQDVVTGDDKDAWQAAMQSEFDSLQANKTWTLVELPQGRKPVTCKWVYKIKYRPDGTVERYKARLVARGFTQRYGMDYKETFSPVVRMDSVRILLALAAQYDLEMVQIDVKTAFLHGTLEEEIFMTQPEGFKQGDDLVCKLQKSIYGLKQASRSWNKCFTDFLKKFDLIPLASDSCVFVSRDCSFEQCNTKPLLIICIYVDDGMLFSNSKKLASRCVSHLQQKFEITVSDPGLFVGIQIERNISDGTLKIHQQFYLQQVIKRFGLDNAGALSIPLSTNMKLDKTGVVGAVSKLAKQKQYMQMIGCLLYSATAVRLDICYSVCLLARFGAEPRVAHWNALKNVTRYLIDKTAFGIVYKRQAQLTVSAYSDADLGGIMVAINGVPVTYKSGRQSLNTTSTVESEFIAAATAAKELIWVRHFMSELSFELELSKLYIDNLGAVTLIKNYQVHAKTKSLDLKLFSIRDLNGKEYLVEHIAGKVQVADVLTKALPRDRLISLLKQVNFSGAVTGQRLEVNLVEAFSNDMANLKKVLLLAYLMLGPACDGFLFGEEYEVTPHHYVMAYHHACDHDLDSQQLKEVADRAMTITEEAKAGKLLYCRSPGVARYEACLIHHYRLQGLISQFGAAARTLRKRGITDEIYLSALEMARVVGSSATLWFKGAVMYGVEQTVVALAQDLLTSITGYSKAAVANNTLVPMNILREDIEHVSYYAEHRPDALNQTVSNMNSKSRFRSYVNQEMFAAEVLLRSILHYLKKGQVDTQALGELIEDPVLMAIPIELTHIRKIIHQGSIVEFFFDVIRKRGFFETIIWLDVTFILLGVGFFGASAFLIFMHCDNKRRSRKNKRSAEQQSGMELPPIDQARQNLMRSRPASVATVNSSGAVRADDSTVEVGLYD